MPNRKLLTPPPRGAIFKPRTTEDDMTKKIAKTKNGREVNLNECREVPGGWMGYNLNGHGHAVAVFIPNDISENPALNPEYGR